MLAMSDTNIEQFFPVFASTNVPVAFLVPTPTGYEKSIMDATKPVRHLLKYSHVHDFDSQGQGQENKVSVISHFVSSTGIQTTFASLYRPMTKKGDPRIWFNGLKKYCSPCNLLALIIIEREIYVINLSEPLTRASLLNHGFVFDILIEANSKDKAVANELLQKLKDIHARGFLPSITEGDPDVGDTLENALGISRNNSKTPDYKGIELKTTRLTRNGRIRPVTRNTLFTKVPDAGLTYREIVKTYGKIQTPRGQATPRLQLYETLRVSRPCAYGLILEVNGSKDELLLQYQEQMNRKYVSTWFFEGLRQALLTKHRETFWVAAVSEIRNGKEYFRYDKVLHTQHPNDSLLEPLIAEDKITVDLAAHFGDHGQWRDHGVLFKMLPKDLHLLFGDPIEYSLF